VDVRWLPTAAIRAIHAELMAEFGGPEARVEEDLLAATLARPRQRRHDEDAKADLATLAAAYGYGFARNHPFTDGNQRMALASMDVFLRLNGHRLAAAEVEAVIVIRQLAAGTLDEAALAEWVRRHHGHPC
jgi:death on curing protein